MRAIYVSKSKRAGDDLARYGFFIPSSFFTWRVSEGAGIGCRPYETIRALMLAGF